MKKLNLLFQKKTCKKTRKNFSGSYIAIFQKLRNGLLLLFACLLSLALHAQKEITGNVKDDNTGEALPGVNVVLKGTNTGTITDADGHYTLSISNDQDVLVFSFIGYLTESITVGNQSVINMNLVPDIVSMQEVVVVGYGTMKKSDISGSIVSIKEKDLQQVKTTNVIESIEGKAAGVDITKSSGEAGAGFSIQIRGARSLSGSNSPLYIVDGVEYGSGIDINPNDIASMEILKDISSTAIYGAKGANGVVIITTKKGVEGKTNITYSAYYGVNKPLGALPYGDRDYYLQYKNDLTNFKQYTRSNVWLPDSELNVVYQPFELEGIAKGTNTNWFNELYSNGYLQNHFLSVSGGKQGITYNLSADYTDEQGMLKGDNYKRYVLKANIDIKVNKRLTVGTSTVLSFKDRDRMAFPAKQVLLMNPLAEPYDSLGNLNINPMPLSTQLTPLWNFQDNNYIRNELTLRTFSSVYVNFKLFESLNLRTNFNADFNNFRSGYYNATLVGTNAGMSITPSKDFTWTNILTFEKDFNQHHIQFTGVHEMKAGNTERYTLEGGDPAILNSLWYALPTLTTNVNYDPGTFSYTEGSLLSFLGRINYAYASKYIFTASLRADGASQLAKVWDYFPSASVAWNISEENFMKNISAISSLKIRGGYGVSGNFTVPTYGSVDRANTSPLYYEFGASELPAFGYRPVYVGNVDLGWEKTASTNIGVDFGLLKNRISGNFDIYKAKTYDLIQQVFLPLHSAIASIWANVGKTETKGIELMLHSVNLARPGVGGLKWTTDLTFTASREKITELRRGVTQDIANGWFVGSPIDVYYDYEKAGIWQFTDSAEMALYNSRGGGFKYGDIKIADQNNDTVIDDEDRTILGTPRPTWYGSLNNTFEYKGFDLSIFIVARYGQMVRDGVMNSYQTRDDYAENGFKANYWTPINPTNEQPRLSPEFSAISLARFTGTLLYTDGSWVKVRDITLGYTVPSKYTSKIKVSSLRLYVSLKNYFVLYSPLFARGRYDPEKGGGTSWPTPKSIIGGLTVEF